MPIGRSGGVLVADIGMTFDEVKRRSTMKVKEPRRMGDGTQLDGSRRWCSIPDRRLGIHFPDSRYYWLATRKEDPRAHHRDQHWDHPAKDVEACSRCVPASAAGQLLADGWMPGHYLAQVREYDHLYGAGAIRRATAAYWLKGIRC